MDFSGPFAAYWNEGLKQNRWTGNPISSNPETWSFGYRPGIDDMTEMNKALILFQEVHDHLPLMHPDIPFILRELKNKYTIVLVSAYPNEDKRISNLKHHEITYDILSCNVRDKAKYILRKEQEGFPPVAIFEDGPQNIEKLLSHYDGKIWSPSQWNYLVEMRNDKRIRFYESPHEWISLLIKIRRI